MDITREKVFGPITVAISYDDEDDAIPIANNTQGAGRRASDPYRRRVAINNAGTSLTEPFGGVKRPDGAESILEFTAIRQILLSESYSD